MIPVHLFAGVAWVAVGAAKGPARSVLALLLASVTLLSVTVRWTRRHRKLLAWTAGGLAAVVAAVAGGGYAVYRHLDGNIDQANISGLVGKPPANLHPQAENILLIGSDSRQGLGPAYAGMTTDQSDTMMLVHIPASRQWAEVMSIPRDSWVSIPSCTMGDGKQSSATQFKINEAFALGNLDGNKTALGAACTVKTLEQDTGIFIDHFMVVNFTGFEGMVSALGGVPECNPTAFTDPTSGIVLSAGQHLLTPPQALAYVRARYGLGDGSDLGRIDRQQAFVSSLISRAKSELLNPLAMYRFLNAATGSLTVDSQLGGINGIYNLEQSLHGIPADKIAFFTVPNQPRGDGANVLWSQPAAGQIFASFRDDTPASPSLFTAATAKVVRGKFGVDPTAAPSAPASIPARTANQSICVG
jgi:LCP family protein required for cell wall assembly